MFRIRVIDRGTGMNVSAVKQMCRVGTSYHQDKARRREIEAWNLEQLRQQQLKEARECNE